MDGRGKKGRKRVTGGSGCGKKKASSTFSGIKKSNGGAWSPTGGKDAGHAETFRKNSTVHARKEIPKAKNDEKRKSKRAAAQTRLSTRNPP